MKMTVKLVFSVLRRITSFQICLVCFNIHWRHQCCTALLLLFHLPGFMAEKWKYLPKSQNGSCWKALFYLQFVSNYGGKSYLSVPFRHRYTFQFVSLTPLKAAMRVLLLSFFFAMQLCKKNWTWWSNVDGQCNQTLNSGTDSVYLYEAYEYADLFFIWFVFIPKTAPGSWSLARGPSFTNPCVASRLILVFPQSA